MEPADVAAIVRAEMEPVRIEMRLQFTGVRENIEIVKDKQDKTNGRVKALELWQARLEGARHATSWIQPAAIAFGASIVAVVGAHFVA